MEPHLLLHMLLSPQLHHITMTAGASSKRQRMLLPLRPYLQPWEAREVCCAGVLLFTLNHCMPC